MAEIPGMFHDAEAARGPSANAHKILYTVAAAGSYGVHVCNKNAVDATIRIALLQGADAAGFSDGGSPPGYSYVTYGRLIEASGGEYDSPAYNLPAGAKIVVWADMTEVTFANTGFGFV